jgi:hypothetical protein
MGSRFHDESHFRRTGLGIIFLLHQRQSTQQDRSIASVSTCEAGLPEFNFNTPCALIGRIGRRKERRRHF